MKNLLKLVSRNWERFSYRLLRIRKRIYQFSRTKEMNGGKTILFVIGCQRSGTTLMTRIFERDFHTRVYGEFSKLSSHDIVHKIRLSPLNLVTMEIDKNKVPLVILKPLVETQNVLKLLAYFNNSRALWMYRNYRDVAVSNLKHWGIRNGINNLRPIAENRPQNWRSENVSEYTRNVVIKYFSEDMNPYDAAALFWFVRNRLFFELNLDNNPSVMMCKYEDLVMNPREMIKHIYEFMGYKYPSDKILIDVHSNSKGKGEDIKLSPEIDLLCKELFEKLNAAYELKHRYVYLQR